MGDANPHITFRMDDTVCAEFFQYTGMVFVWALAKILGTPIFFNHQCDQYTGLNIFTDRNDHMVKVTNS